jgi:predicted  nucleic acid-binding Zn-ribbon protein
MDFDYEGILNRLTGEFDGLTKNLNTQLADLSKNATKEVIEELHPKMKEMKDAVSKMHDSIATVRHKTKTRQEKR